MVSKKSTPRAMGSFNDGIIKTEAMTGSNGSVRLQKKAELIFSMAGRALSCQLCKMRIMFT